MTSDVQRTYDAFPYPRPSTGPDLIPDVSHALSLVLRHDRLPGWRVLDAGCGTGHRLVAIARQHPEARFVGVDTSEPSLRVARALAEEHGADNVEFVAADLRALDGLGVFDLIVCSGVLHHLADPAAGLRSLADRLAPDGLLYAWLYHAIGEHDRMVDRELVHLLGRDDPDGPDLDVVRALGLSLDPDRYGTTPRTDELSEHTRSVLDADAYLTPVVRPLRFADIAGLVAGSGLEWAAAVGVNYGGGSRLLDLSGDLGSPFHVTLDELFPPELAARTDAWDVAARLAAVELRTRPTGFAVVAGVGAALAECEPWLANNVFTGQARTDDIAAGQAAGDRRRRRMVREALAPQLDELRTALVDRHGAEPMRRIGEALDMATGRSRRELTDPRQRPALFHLPGLPARPWVDPADHPELQRFVTALERDWEVVRAELEALNGGFVGYLDGDYMNAKFDSPAAGAWQSLTVFADDEVPDEVARRCPTAAAVLRDSAALLSGDAIVSRLRPGAVLAPHVDDNDYKLTLHLGLRIPRGARIRVDRETREWQEGRCLVFSDAYEHEVWNDSEQPRDILLIDIWHPDLDPREREALRDVRGVLRPACEPGVFDQF